MYVGSISDLGFGVFSKEKYKNKPKTKPQHRTRADYSRMVFHKFLCDPNLKYIITNGDIAGFNRQNTLKKTR